MIRRVVPAGSGRFRHSAPEVSSRVAEARALALGLAIVCAYAVSAAAQEEPPFTLVGGNVQRRADGALTLMAFSVVPDLAGSSLQIKSASTDNPGIQATQFGGSAFFGDRFVGFVEGSLGLSRYDPKFIATNGVERREIPAKWTTIAGTGGIGAGIKLISELRFIAVFDFSLGHVESDASVLGRAIKFYTGKDIDFLKRGRLNAYGLGGAAILDFSRFWERYSLELQARSTNILLQSFDSSSGADGEADAATVSLYARLRGPTGLMLMRRPVRYVLELSHSNYVGDQRGVLGFNFLSSAGAGLEIDISAYHTVISRVRWVFRYFFGENVSGFGGSIAASF